MEGAAAAAAGGRGARALEHLDEPGGGAAAPCARARRTCSRTTAPRSGITTGKDARLPALQPRRAHHVTFYSRALLERARALGGAAARGLGRVSAGGGRRSARSRADERAAVRRRLAPDGGRAAPQRQAPASAGRSGARCCDAFAEVRRERPDAVLLLAGQRARWRRALKAQAEALGLGPAVRFLGLVPNDEVARAAGRGRPLRALVRPRGHAHRGPGGAGLRHARRLDGQSRAALELRGDLRLRRARGAEGRMRARWRGPSLASPGLAAAGAPTRRRAVIAERFRVDGVADRYLGALRRGPRLVRTIDEAALSEAAAARFRSEYDYAVFEYRRSAKVMQALESAGVSPDGRVLDAGCGGGGTALSLAEESALRRRSRPRGALPRLGHAAGAEKGRRQRRLRAGRRRAAPLPDGRLRPRVQPFRDRARRLRRGLPARVLPRAADGRRPLPLDRAHALAGRSPPSAPARPRPAAPARRAPRVLRDLPLAGPPRALDAAGAEGGQHVHRAGRGGQGEAGRRPPGRHRAPPPVAGSKAPGSASSARTAT